jgi:hypothetical protein
MKYFLQKTVWFLWVLGVAVSLAGYAQACSTPALTGAHNAMVPAKSPDSALFDSAVLRYVNKVRCSKGLSALTSASGLVDVAEVHSKWMAKFPTAQSQIACVRDEYVQKTAQGIWRGQSCRIGKYWCYPSLSVGNSRCFLDPRSKRVSVRS